MADDNSACDSTASSAQIALLTMYTVSHKKTEPTYLFLQLRENQRILMQFSVLDLAMNDTREGINFTHLA